MRVLAAFSLVFVIAVAGCPGGGSPPPPNPSPDLAAEGLGGGWGTCTPDLLGGGACPGLGAQMACSTWEHDHCCVCALVDGRRTWVCDGPHAVCSQPILAPDGGVTVGGNGGGCTLLPVSWQTCPAEQLGESFSCQPYTLAAQLCCTCTTTPGGTHWECHNAWSCPPPDLGGTD